MGKHYVLFQDFLFTEVLNWRLTCTSWKKQLCRLLYSATSVCQSAAVKIDQLQGKMCMALCIKTALRIL